MGKNHLDVAEILQNLGVLYDDMGKLEESLGCYQDCLRVRRDKLNDDQHDQSFMKINIPAWFNFNVSRIVFTIVRIV